MRYRRTGSARSFLGSLAVISLGAGLIAFTGPASAAPGRAATHPAHAGPAGRVAAFDARAVRSSTHAVKSSRTTTHTVAGTKVPVLYVNSKNGSDTSTCRLQKAPCATIAYALTQAPSPVQIDLAAGTYAEQVVVGADLDVTLHGAGEAKTILEPSSIPVSDPDTDSSQAVYPIVDAQPGSTVNLNDLTVNGSAAESSFDGCADDFTGVYYHDASGAVSSVDVTNIELPPALFGCQAGLGIYAAADSGSFTNVTMSSIQVSNYDKNGVTCDDAGTTCSLSGSIITGIGATSATAQNGFQGDGAASLTLHNDKVTGNTYTGSDYGATGVLLLQDGSTTITGGSSAKNDFDVYDLADASLSISTYTASSATNDNGLGGVGIGLDSLSSATVSGVTADRDNSGGIILWGSSDVTLENSTADSDNGGIAVTSDGTTLSTATGDTVLKDVASNDTGVGFYADSSTSGNTFESDVAKHDTAYDFQDASSGTGTAGTANTWSDNTCTPVLDSSPEGLC